MRADTSRGQIEQLRKARPFCPFAILLENGRQAPITHSENVAHDPGGHGKPPSRGFSVVSNGMIRNQKPWSPKPNHA